MEGTILQAQLNLPVRLATFHSPTSNSCRAGYIRSTHAHRLAHSAPICTSDYIFLTRQFEYVKKKPLYLGSSVFMTSYPVNEMRYEGLESRFDMPNACSFSFDTQPEPSFRSCLIIVAVLFYLIERGCGLTVSLFHSCVSFSGR